MTENEARQMEVEIKWNGRANVCVHCGKVPETYYITTGHDHTDDSIRYCFCRSVAPSIKQLQAKVAELEEEIGRLRADNIAFARNLKGKSATTGATYEHLCTQLAAAQEEINRPPAIDAYEMYMADDEESNPVERLRFFLSLALKDQDWIDVEKFIDDVSNHIAKAEQRVAEACAKWIDGYAGIHQKEMLSDTAKSFADALRRGEWRKFVKEM